MKWCMDCGAVGKPEPATTTVDGDPVCNGCARARGAEPAAAKLPIVTPSAPKEKAMSTKLCGCGCGADMQGSPWNFKRGHKPAKLGGGSTVQPPKPSQKTTPAVPATFKGLAQPGFLDELWSGLSADLKRKALRALVEWDGSPNLV